MLGNWNLLFVQRQSSLRELKNAIDDGNVKRAKRIAVALGFDDGRIEDVILRAEANKA